jgi:hypothetical protein
MPTRHLMVTPLPTGRSGNTGTISVHLFPRLRVAGTLKDYLDFRNWGTFMAAAPAMQFQFVINGVNVPAGGVTRVSAPVKTAVWRAVFGAPTTSNTPVDPYTFVDRTALNLTSVDSVAMQGALQSLTRTQTLKGSTVTQRSDLEAVMAGAQGALAEALTFCGQVGNGQDPVAPQYDFHAIVHFLSAHFQIALPAVALNTVQVVTNWATKAGVRPRDEVPFVVRVDNDFRAVVLDPAYRTGNWLTLPTSNYAVAQLDAPGMTTQLNHLSRSLANAPAATRPSVCPAASNRGCRWCTATWPTCWSAARHGPSRSTTRSTSTSAPPAPQHPNCSPRTSASGTGSMPRTSARPPSAACTSARPSVATSSPATRR